MLGAWLAVAAWSGAPFAVSRGTTAVAHGRISAVTRGRTIVAAIEATQDCADAQRAALSVYRTRPAQR